VDKIIIILLGHTTVMLNRIECFLSCSEPVLCFCTSFFHINALILFNYDSASVWHRLVFAGCFICFILCVHLLYATLFIFLLFS